MKPLLLALSLLSVSVAPDDAYAQSSPETLYDVTGISAGSVLNVRNGPGTSHTVVATLPPGVTGLRLVECQGSGGWCRIDDGQGIDGWVAARFLEGAPTLPAEPAAPSIAPWQSMFSTEVSYRVTGIGANSSLNMRAGPGTGQSVIARLPSGRSGLTILDCTDAGDWCKVSIGSSAPGWVATRYLSKIVDAGDASGEPVPQRAMEATRLATITGIEVNPGGTTTIPRLPVYLLGSWDVDTAACQREDSRTRVVVQPNGLRVGASNARFKNAIFQDGGYDLIALLMETQEGRTAVPQRALYRLEPQGDVLAISGDVLEVQRLRKCEA